MKIRVFDYGAGNLHSLLRVLRESAEEVTISADLSDLSPGELLFLPGVGAFGHAAQRLAPFRDPVRAAVADGMAVFGICLGMQLLFDRSEEGPGPGLGLIAGDVVRLRTQRLPHMGWNEVSGGHGWAYFAHSFVCLPKDPSVVQTWSTHEGVGFAATVRAGRVGGAQFHPEKSGAAGAAFLRAQLQELAS
ncbi:MAG: imidazole glycerol phosphate synthase subunit HisH [Myxococcota bacterium]|nr:imidazole glycerol phosphate synthase subunit HisH [Myxococcota bacterium]